MARKKSTDKPAAKVPAINFKCSAELKASIEDLARLSRRDVSAILVELCTEYVKANRQRITNFRRQAAQPLKMPTFSMPAKKVTAPTSKGEVTADEPPPINADSSSTFDERR